MKRIDENDPRNLGYMLLESTRSMFQACGWNVQTPESDQDVDLIVTKGRKRYLVQLKVSREGRKQLLESLWANAYLRTQKAARELQGEPLPMVGTAALSDTMVEELTTYIRRYAPNVAYGLIDARGRLELSGAGLPHPEDAIEHKPAIDGVLLKVRPLDLFSDLNQWMLKVLLARRLHPSLLAAPRARIRKATELADVAGVSVPSAYRLIGSLEDEGFLTTRRQTLEIVHTEELLHRWKQSSLRPVAEMPMRFLFASGPADTQLRKALVRYTERRLGARPEPGEPLSWKSQRAALGLFSAAKELDLGFVQGAAAHLYLEDDSTRVLEDLGLTPAHPGEAVHVFIRRPRYKETTFRGLTDAAGAPSTDVIQTWLDVSLHPARGAEQADYIWNQILGPQLLRED